MVRREALRRPLVTGVVVAAWLAALLVPPVMLLRLRAEWLQHWDRPEAQSRWDEFRQDMREQSGRDGPVQRKVPKSDEPPARVWLRDYFGLAVVAWVLFAGVLGGVFGVLVLGVLRGAEGGRRQATTSLAKNQPGSHSDDQEKHERDADDTQEGKHGWQPRRK